MLTNREKKWLKKRERYPFYGCQYCEFDKFGRHCMSEGIKANNGKMRCLIVPKKEAFKEAAEFSERVAKKLASLFADSTEIAPVCAGCPCEDDCYANRHLKCTASILKYARLQVEEEMEK